MKLPEIDVQYDVSNGGIDWRPLAAMKREGQQLLRGLISQARQVASPDTLMFLKFGARALNLVFGSHYRDEVMGLAKALGTDDPGDILIANLVYDLSHAGCSTFACDLADGGQLHARNLDWPFPRGLLQKRTTIVRVHGAPCGDYTLVTWPGFFGGLTAIKPSRFSVTINHVQSARHSVGHHVVWNSMKGRWPAPWAVRRTLDTCRTFSQAVDYLSTERLIAPVLFTVAGTKPGQAVVIERTPDAGVRRKPAERRVWTTNHYRSKKLLGFNANFAESDTVERGDRLDDLLRDGGQISAATALRLLSEPGLLRDDTAHQVVMVPRTGELVVRIPGCLAETVPTT